MKKIAVALASLLAAFGANALAEGESRYDPQWQRYEQSAEEARIERDRASFQQRSWRDERAPYYNRESPKTHRECWNPRARHFENVREGEFQDDLDYRRCRVVSDEYSAPNRWR
jgi:hypothetical protein